MNGFESFDIRAWVVDELFTRHVKTQQPQKKPPQRLNPQLRTRFILPVAGAVAALYLSAAPATAQTYARTESLRVSQSSASSDPDLIPGDPKIYWSRLIDELKHRPPAPESQVVDPDPLF